MSGLSYVAIALGAVLVTGCENASSTCAQEVCTGGATYALCPAAHDNLVYDFGDTSCACDESDTTDCQHCEEAVAAFCAGATDGGAPASANCSAVFSGAFNGAWAGCAISVTYTPMSSTFSIATRGSILPGQENTWTGFSLVLSGAPAIGTVSETSSIGAAEQISNLTISNSPEWLASHEQSTTIGALSVQLDTLGPALVLGDGSVLYASPHGTSQSTLVDENATTMQPNESVAVTF